MAEEPLEPVGPPPEESQNRVFVLVALGLGGLFIVGLILIALFAFVIAPGQRRARSIAATGTAQGNQALEQMLTQTALAGLGGAEDKTELPPATAIGAAVTNTPLIPPSATNTVPPTITNTPGPSPTTILPAASLTPQPLRTRTPTPSLVGGGSTATPTRRPTATALPATGFADDVGLPGLIILGVGLVAALVIARRVRMSRV